MNFLEKTIKSIDELKKIGIIDSYAICGGIASLFYIEPVSTYDLDVMIFLSSEKNPLNPLEDVFQWAKSNNYEFDREYIVIENIPVQFLPVFNELVGDAVRNSILFKVGETDVPVLRSEYLMAIMLDVNRPKDRERLIRFFSSVAFDEQYFESILNKFSLRERYESFKQKYGDE